MDELLNPAHGISWGAIIFLAGGCYWLLRSHDHRLSSIERSGSPHIKVLNYQVQTCATRLDQIEQHGSPGVEVIHTKIDQLSFSVAALTRALDGMRTEFSERSEKQMDRLQAISERVAKLER